jgi:hypothetical protein
MCRAMQADLPPKLRSRKAPARRVPGGAYVRYKVIAGASFDFPSLLEVATLPAL